MTYSLNVLPGGISGNKSSSSQSESSVLSTKGVTPAMITLLFRHVLFQEIKNAFVSDIIIDFFYFFNLPSVIFKKKYGDIPVVYVCTFLYDFTNSLIIVDCCQSMSNMNHW